MAIIARQAIAALKNGLGFLYIRNEEGAIKKVFNNNSIGVDSARLEATLNIPLGHNIAAFGAIKVNSVTGSGTISSITIRGVNQISAAITFTGLGNTALATAIKDAINSHDPGPPDYTATSKTDTVTVQAPVAEGETANSDTIVMAFTGAGTVTTTITEPFGGASVFKDTFGDDILFDADFDSQGCSGKGTALSTVIGANAVKINSVFIPLTLNAGSITETTTIASGVITVERRANEAIFKVLNEGGNPSDNLIDIRTEGYSDGDKVWLIQGASGQDYTTKSTGNLKNVDSVDFTVDSAQKAILFRYNATAQEWDEVTRTSVLTVNDTTLRLGGVSTGLSGITTFTVTAPGGTDTATPATTAKNIVIDGDIVALTSNYTLALSTTGAIDGEPFLIFYINPVTTGGTKTVTIGGITLSDDQATKGIVAMAFFDSANSAYEVKILVDAATTFVDNEKISDGEIVETKLKDQGIVAGSFTNVNVTITKEGIITAIANGSVAGGTNLASVLYVDTAGDNSTAVKGDLHKAWKDWDVALTAATSGDTVILTPGTHNASSVLKDGVSIYFMEGAKIIYSGADGAVMADTGTVSLTLKISGSPYIEHAGSGTDKFGFLLSGTGTHQIEFVNAEFYGTVIEKVVKINNPNAKVRFVNCLFRQASNIDVVEMAAFNDSKIYFDDCWIVNENSGGAANGILLGDDSVAFDGTRIQITSGAAFALKAPATRTVKLYSNIFSNADVGGGATVTNLIPTTTLVKDADLVFYR